MDNVFKLIKNEEEQDLTYNRLEILVDTFAPIVDSSVEYQEIYMLLLEAKLLYESLGMPED